MWVGMALGAACLATAVVGVSPLGRKAQWTLAGGVPVLAIGHVLAIYQGFLRFNERPVGMPVFVGAACFLFGQMALLVALAWSKNEPPRGATDFVPSQFKPWQKVLVWVFVAEYAALGITWVCVSMSVA